LGLVRILARDGYGYGELAGRTMLELTEGR